MILKSRMSLGRKTRQGSPMKLNPQFLMVALMFCGISACAPSKPKTDESKPADSIKVPVKDPELVGRIASVPADKRFVLIQSYGKWNGESGQILTTRGPENRTANLKTTGEKLGEFSAADLQSGTVEIGDAVYLQHVPKPVTNSTPTETPLPQENPPPENVQKNN